MLVKSEKYKEYKRIYQLKYYHKNENIRVECEYCKCFVTKAGMKKHINTEKCMNIREKINNTNNINSANIAYLKMKLQSSNHNDNENNYNNNINNRTSNTTRTTT